MPAPDYQQELDAAVAAARQAGALVRARIGQAGAVQEKGLHDLVTETDEASQRLILNVLANACPGIEALAEEGASEEELRGGYGRPRWIIDPIDGTTNFTHGVSPFCISIALHDGADLVLGVVYEVTADELFAAVRGRGLTLNGVPASVSGTEELEHSLITTGFPFRLFWYLDAYLDVLRQLMLSTRGLRRPGAAAADLAYVACGRFDGYFEAGIAPWDVAAGIVLVREGGGRVTTLGGAEQGMLFGGQILATNGHLHQPMQTITAPLGKAYAAGLSPSDRTR
ncbi:MAG: inositol monophosphatase family protein [Bacteroidota bacterium]